MSHRYARPRLTQLAYEDFLAAKVCAAPRLGLEIEASEISPILKPHQRDAVLWAVRGGRRALFEAFGLGKTLQQLEIVRLILAHVGGRGLIVHPLGVRQEFVRDAALLGVPVRFVRADTQVAETGIHLTNYETVRDGKLDPRLFTVVSLDEAACLRGFGGSKTFRECMAQLAGDDGTTGQKEGIPYRFVATATPSPNEFIELLAYSAFLGVMDVSDAKTRWFKRNSEKADALTLHEHAEEEFWRWVSSWALFLQKPSDLGYSDDGYELPELDVRWHELPTNHAGAGADPSGQLRLIKNASLGVQTAAREKRDSLPARIEKLLELRAEDPAAHRVIWHDLESERAALEDALPSTEYGHWLEFRDGHPAALALYERHYSARKYADGRERRLFVGPGEKLVLLTRAADALFAWRRFVDDSGQQGVNCSVFRNEGSTLSSELVLEASAIAWLRWPGERLYTYFDPQEIRSTNPGFCFLAAGWKRCGETSGGLVVLEALPGIEVPAITPRAALRTVYGTQDLDEREQIVIDFSEGRIAEIGAKPVMLGSGCNLQRHCSWAVFLGIGFKFKDLVQAVHRLQRFLQPNRVRIDFIYTEAERSLRELMERRWSQHREMVERMAKLIQEHGLAHATVEPLERAMVVERQEVVRPRYRLINGDAIEETRKLDSNSVDLIVTSIPFGTQYSYVSNYRDLGHTNDDAHFFEHMGYLTPELLRVLKPGRVAAIHVKDRIVPSGMSGMGFQTVSPFSDYTIAHYRQHGFGFLARKTVVTDVVRENNQTYRLGWTEQCKDGSRMGCGLPEYVLLFRKPPTDRSNGYADEPVRKDKARYTRSRWQIDAHGFMRSSGNRPLMPEDLDGVPHERIFKMFREYGLSTVYDFEQHVALSESLERCTGCGHIHVGERRCAECLCPRSGGRLPVTFMLLQPPSWHEDVWTDVARMRTLNMVQAAKNRAMHVCPLQFDIVDRLIEQFSMKDEFVFDPFMGIGTVAHCAIGQGRRALGTELSPAYFADSVFHAAAAESKLATPTLFDLMEADRG